MRDRDDVPLWRPIWQWDWNDWGRWTLLAIWIIAVIFSWINKWAMQTLAWDYGAAAVVKPAFLHRMVIAGTLGR